MQRCLPHHPTRCNAKMAASSRPWSWVPSPASCPLSALTARMSVSRNSDRLCLFFSQVTSVWLTFVLSNAVNLPWPANAMHVGDLCCVLQWKQHSPHTLHGTRFVTPFSQKDNGVLDRNLPSVVNISSVDMLGANSAGDRRRQADLFSQYNLNYTFDGCQNTEAITSIQVDIDRSGKTPVISALRPMCSTNFTMRSGFMTTQASIVSYSCNPGKFFTEWIVFASMGTVGASSKTQDLSIQAICSDNMSVPILGDSRDWYRVVRSVKSPSGKLMVVTGTNATDGTAVITELMGVSNPRAPPPNPELRRNYTCRGMYDRITDVDASIAYGGDGWILHDVQVMCRLCMQGISMRFWDSCVICTKA